MSAFRSEFSTAAMLAAKFNHQPFISLLDIADEYLGLTPAMAKRKARNNDLPFPVLRLSPSQKAPWLVKFECLVQFVEQASNHAEQNWRRMQC